MINILVTGSNGQLGSALQVLAKQYTQYQFYFTDVAELDITDKSAIAVFVSANSIYAIVNCAAYTAVDKAESDLELADKINHLAVKYLAEVAKEHQCKLIHISTDYVFDGTHHIPYLENDVPNPQSVYGKTKLAGEQVLQEINPSNSIIIRTSWIYSSFGANFVKTMLKLGKERDELRVITDQVGTPTYAADLAQTILTILPHLSNEKVEVYHYTNEGVCSWYDFAQAIFEISKIDCKVIPITTAQYPTAAQRPHYSVLNKTQLKEKFKIEIPYWRDSLRNCLKKMSIR
ncbi:MAG TPA: dTDP-4-dehydrorhamnose reductase [Flavobacteriaceae bacterium]|nr:dTDP-4-dehydrorhamnose reductase [Flavobacteriaceae bacterium]